MKTLAFFNNSGGAGKTSIVYHLAHMVSELGVSVLAADLDPQSNLSVMLLGEDTLAQRWQAGQTLSTAVHPLRARTGDIQDAHVEAITPLLHAVLGDLNLSGFEDLLSENWSKCLTGEEGAFRVISALYRVLHRAAKQVDAALVLMDVGPNLGALNRAALLAADNLVLPLSPDLFSVQGMENLGSTLKDWRRGWAQRKDTFKTSDLLIPSGAMQPAGYIVMSFGVRDSRPVKAYEHWLARIPLTYRRQLLSEPKTQAPAVANDPNCLATLQHYRSLMPLAMTARKPMFDLKAADGITGVHIEAVRRCYQDFERLAGSIAAAIDLPGLS